MARILVVDDAAFMRMTIKKMVTPHGHEVVGEAGNGAEAVKRYAELRPDLVLMDITMPEMNGVEAVQKLKELDSNVKVIMVSAMGQQEMVVRALTAGAKNFIVKPFEESTLIGAIEKIAR